MDASFEGWWESNGSEMDAEDADQIKRIAKQAWEASRHAQDYDKGN